MNSRALVLTLILGVSAAVLGSQAPPGGLPSRPEGAMLLWALTGLALIVAAIRPSGPEHPRPEP
jgi:hypothetical protein